MPRYTDADLVEAVNYLYIPNGCCGECGAERHAAHEVTCRDGKLSAMLIDLQRYKAAWKRVKDCLNTITAGSVLAEMDRLIPPTEVE